MHHQSLAEMSPSRRYFEYIVRFLVFYSIGSYEQTLPFYLKRTVTLVEYQDEMAFGLQHEPKLWIPTIREFTPIWNAQPYALAVMGPEMYEQLEKSGLPMQLIARDTERVFVRTPPR